MSNVTRATLVINETYADEYVRAHMTPLKVAQALADATPPLLMPDLPVRDEFGEWGIDPLVVRIDTATRDVCLEDTDPYEGRAIYMLPDKAREVALALLAAASYAERNKE